ncbi:thylakoid lumenal 29 kDa protein [Striga asiatica]|uniref:Thylakoid lumenal 29 kDa protein n=1 Tax=Striga asiatica TaxID=4170 RepID=A0A5A7NZ32_STRAF|nr:thylakoid lumenal 29 kDa protein [Striga asiatica]
MWDNTKSRAYHRVFPLPSTHSHTRLKKWEPSSLSQPHLPGVAALFYSPSTSGRRKFSRHSLSTINCRIEAESLDEERLLRCRALQWFTAAAVGVDLIGRSSSLIEVAHAAYDNVNNVRNFSLKVLSDLPFCPQPFENVVEMKGNGPFSVMPRSVGTEALLASDPDVLPWVQKYQHRREPVSQTDYEVDLITTLT